MSHGNYCKHAQGRYFARRAASISGGGRGRRRFVIGRSGRQTLSSVSLSRPRRTSVRGHPSFEMRPHSVLLIVKSALMGHFDGASELDFAQG